MATFAQIKEIRLRINDPAGFIDIVESSPVSGTSQIAYLDGGVYKNDAGTVLQIEVNDTRLGDWYDNYGTTGAVVRAIRQIIVNIGSKLPLVRSESGPESVQYTSLADLYNYYKGLLSDAEDLDDSANDNSSGRVATASSVEIAGGNL